MRLPFGRHAVAESGGQGGRRKAEGGHCRIRNQGSGVRSQGAGRLAPGQRPGFRLSRRIAASCRRTHRSAGRAKMASACAPRRSDRDRTRRSSFLPDRANARAKMFPFGSATNDAPQNSIPSSFPTRFTATTNTPLAIAWLRIMVSQAACWLGAVFRLFRVQPADGRRIEQNLGTAQGRQPRRLGIPLIPADQRSDAAELAYRSP